MLRCAKVYSSDCGIRCRLTRLQPPDIMSGGKINRFKITHLSLYFNFLFITLRTCHIDIELCSCRQLAVIHPSLPPDIIPGVCWVKLDLLTTLSRTQNFCEAENIRCCRTFQTFLGFAPWKSGIFLLFGIVNVDVSMSTTYSGIIYKALARY